MNRRVTLITGASSGIGRALALECGRGGDAVVVNFSKSSDGARDAVESIEGTGGTAIAIRADVARPDQVDGMIAEILDRFGRLDVVINNAGIGPIVGLDHLDQENFDEVLRTNLSSAFIVSQAAIPHIKASGGGRLIFVSSLAAKTGGVISAAYAASKAGLEGLMHYYAAALLKYRITANAIAPAFIQSGMLHAAKLPSVQDLPLGRLGKTDEIWAAVRMLLETEYMTGQTIHINAGRYMT